MGVCKLDRDCISCHAFDTEKKGRGSCMLYGRGKDYVRFATNCVCKQCLIKVMCSRICEAFNKQLLDEEFILIEEMNNEI